MHCWKKRVINYLVRFALIVMVGTLLADDAGGRKTSQFSQVVITLGEDEKIYLDAQVSYSLNDTLAEALQNGVSLTFETHVRMRLLDAWFWQLDVADHHVRQILRYRALSGLYEVLTPGVTAAQQTKQAFATPSAALRYLGHIRDLQLIERNKLNLAQQYVVRLTAYLDIEALPLPLRLNAYLSPEWSLTAEPWEWQLKP